MKTPDEIKKGLECCNTYNDCQSCPYDDKVEKGWGCCVQRNADALAYIRQLEAKVSQWISVKERLPDDNEGEILVVGTDKEATTGWCVNGRICFRVGPLFVQAANITHWMPLPEPPEE